MGTIELSDDQLAIADNNSDNLIDINGEEINYSKEAKNLLDEINAIIPE